MPRETEKRVMRNVGRRVAELRAEHGLTQQELAEAGGFSAKYLQRIEAGEANLTIRSLVRLARLMQVSTRELFEPAKTRRQGRGRPRSRS